MASCGHWAALAAAVGLAAAAGVGAMHVLAGPQNIVQAQDALGAEPVRLRERDPGGGRPLVVVLADNEGTETTDFIVPFGVLKESGVAEVVAVSSAPGPVQLMPALRIRADTTVERFEAETPRGADVVVVPAMHRTDNPVVLDFLRRQHDAGALIVAICDGAWVLAKAGLLEGRHATGHWFSFRRLARRFPGTTWVRNARYVVDGPIMSSTGVAASIPISIALLEAIAGPQEAGRVAARLGVDDWSPAHDSAGFAITAGAAWTAAANAARLGKQTLAAQVRDGFDEIAFALQADAWSRTYRSRLVAVNGHGAVTSRRGLVLEPEAEAPGAHPVAVREGPPEPALDETLRSIAQRHGSRTAGLVALQLEYDWPAEARP